MKTFLSLMVFVFCLPSEASMKYFLIENAGSMEIVGHTRAPKYPLVCRLSKRVPISVLDVEIVTYDEDGVETARRDFTALSDVDRELGERVECSVDQAALDAHIAEKEAEKTQEESRQAKLRKLMGDFKTHCSSGSNYADKWANNKTAWHRCNSFAWKAISNLIDTLSENEFE